MSEVSIARRYARALYDEAEHTGLTEEVGREMEFVQSTLSQSRELRLLLANPTVPREKKRSVVARLFGGSVGDLTQRFLQLVVSKGRESILHAVAGAYGTLNDERMGIQEVRAHSAIALSRAEETLLTEALEHATSKKVRLVAEVDPQLLGGVVVRVGDMVHDGSVRHRLSMLRERLKTGNPT